MGYIRDEELSKEDLQKKLDQEHEKWLQIARFGSVDPFWPDGMGLNLTRAHILFFSNLIREKEKEGEQISFFDLQTDKHESRPVPPEVPSNFMVKDGAYVDRLNRTWAEKDLSQLIFGTIDDYL